MNKLTATTTSQLVFYTLTGYAGTPVRVDYGEMGSVADSASAWDLQSVAVGDDGLQAFLFSQTNINDASMSYTGHVDMMAAEDIPDLHAKLGSPQYGIRYLGVDTRQTSRVVVAMSVAEGGADALACTWLESGGTDNVTTFSRNGVNGTLGFVNMTDGSSEQVNCRSGAFNANTGTVAWSDVESRLTLTRSAGKIEITGVNNFPQGWTFGEPVQQSDGSWLVQVVSNEQIKLDIYPITDAPAEDALNPDEHYDAYNKIALYSYGDTTVNLQLSGSAKFRDTNNSTLTAELNAEIMQAYEFYDNVEGSVDITVTGNNIDTTTVSVQFTNLPFQDNKLRMVANSGAPADSKTANSVYFDSRDIHPNSLHVVLSGTAVFAGTTSQDKVFTLSSAPYDCTFDITNKNAEEIIITATVNTGEEISCSSFFAALK